MRLLKIAVVNLGLLLAIIGLAEVAFGNWFGRNGLALLNIPRSADIIYDVILPDGGGWKAHYQRDALGLRGTFGRLEEVAMVILGGSTTDQRLLSTPDTWPEVMAKGLAEKGKALSVANAGVDGQSTIGHLKALEVWLKPLDKLRPRYVLVYVGINDVAIGSELSSYDSMVASSSWLNHLRDRSALYSLWRIARGMIRAEKYSLNHSLKPAPAEDWEIATPAENPPPGLEAYARRLEALSQAIMEWGAQPIFVTQPMRDMKVENHVVLVRKGMRVIPALDAYNRQTLTVCARLSLTCLDLATQLPFAPGDFYDPIHYTPQGAARIGRWLSEQLAGHV